MDGPLFEQSSPGSTRCILIGDPASAGHSFERFDALLWIVDAASLTQKPAGITEAAVEKVDLDARPLEEVFAAIDRFVLRDPRRLPWICVGRNVLRHRPAAYQSVLAELHAQLTDQEQARATRQEVGFFWQKHVFANVAAYGRRRVPTSWAGALRGLPAFVCGAGSSLDVSLPRLAAAAGTGIVVAADSSLRALARAGVQADFAVSVDWAKTPEKCLGPDLPPTRMILSPLSPPAWNQALRSEQIFYLANNHLTIDWLAEQGVARTEIGVTENCGSTGLGLARYLGCSPLYLFGIDLAPDPRDPQRHRHAGVEASLYPDAVASAPPNGPQIPGNYAATVATHLFGDWRTLDRRLAAWPAGLVVNVNDRGARLRNTQLVSPGQFQPDSVSVEKAPLLARLGPPGQEDRPAVDAALRHIAATGARTAAAVEALRDSLQTEGPDALVTGMRVLFHDPTFGRIFGAFSLKVLPHLVPPREKDAAFWSRILDELAELSRLASVAAPPSPDDADPTPGGTLAR